MNKNKTKFVFPILIIMFSSIVINAQKTIKSSEKSRTQWMSGHMPKKTNQTYYYKVVNSNGSSINEAKNNAFASLLIELGNNQGVTITSKSIHEIKTSNNSYGYHEKETTQHLYNIERDGLKTAFKKVDEYWELIKTKNQTLVYNIWVLYAVANNPDSYSFENVNFTTNYKSSAFFRSVIVPGWGQLHKKEKKKGISILVSETVFVSGFFVSDNFRKSYRQKALDTYDITKRRAYLKKADDYEMMRNASGIASIAVYVYNIIDVLTAKGAKHYANTNNKKYRFYASTNKDYVALSLSINF